MASRWAADSLIRTHGIDARRVHVVGYGRNVNITPPADRDWSAPRFLFIGWDWHRKNGDTTVKAFLRLRLEVNDARLDVVGRHPPLEVEGVTGHGPIAVYESEGRAQIEALFAQATCLVVPSFLEPFGMVYVEAAAAGVPSIATSVGGTLDSVGPGGILVDPSDSEAIYRAMRSMCEPEAARLLGIAARKHASKLTWSGCCQRVLRALDLPPIADVELAEFL
jgi:glycosyltransferase involved in cell wall biosynthesis